MGFEGVKINRSDNGLEKGTTADRVCALVAGVKDGSRLEPYSPVELLQIEDLERLGITAETDAANKALIHYHVSEYFRLSPETSLWLIAVPVDSTVSTLAGSEPLKAAVRSIARVNTLAFAACAADETLQAAVAAAQLLVDGFTAEHIYIDALLLEGTGNYLAGEIATYPDLRAMDAPNVSVVVAHDPAIATGHAAPAHAAIGAALGMLAVRAVHENLGSVDIESKPRARRGEQDYSLTDTKRGLWLDAALSNGKRFCTLTGADQKKLDTLGYIYAGQFAGYGGFFFSNSHTATATDSDYAFIERNAVWNKAARVIRATLIPRVRSKVEADPSTGYIRSTTLSDWSARVRSALEKLTASGNVSDFDLYIDPNQLAVSNDPFNIQVRLVANGVVHEFEIDLGFTNKI